jgi:hypothetical protein
MHTFPPCSNFSKKSVPGIASDVATRGVAIEWAPEGQWQRQRWWQTTPMVSNSFSQKKISTEREWDDSCFCCNLSVTIFLGAHQPAMNYCRKLVQAYTCIQMYKKKSQMLQIAPARMITSLVGSQFQRPHFSINKRH